MFRCKAHEILRNEAYDEYAGLAELSQANDERWVQRNRWTFYNSTL